MKTNHVFKTWNCRLRSTVVENNFANKKHSYPQIIKKDRASGSNTTLKHTIAMNKQQVCWMPLFLHIN